VRRTLALSIGLIVGAAGLGGAQALAPAGTGGVAALASALRQLGANKRVLFIAAHPDDEDTQLLTYLSRGLGAQAAYLSLSRGEGGQNLIGAELGPELGIIRTEELLAARATDGARQFFTRAYDFGFSKSAGETLRMWPHDTLLRDVVALIRRFRPQIIVAQFAGNPRDGHGQHQASGIIAREAFELLRDTAWGPKKFYRSSRFDTAGTNLIIALRGLDPFVGQSYSQIAQASRSKHRSQDMGALQAPGPSIIRQIMVGGPAGTAGALFAGVDTIMKGKERFAALIDSARAVLSPWDPASVLPFLARALPEVGAADSEQRTILEGAIANAAGVVLDGIADDWVVTPGQRVQVEVAIWNAGAAPVQLDSVAVAAPPGWTIERLEATASAVAPGSVATRRFAVSVSRDAASTQPYFRRRPLVGGGYYDWTGAATEWRGDPFEPPPVTARARLTIAGAPVTLEREVVYRFRDQAVGEVRRPLFVAQDFDVAVEPSSAIWPLGDIEPRQFMVMVRNRTRGPATARIVVTPPPGWSAVTAESLSFAREDEARSVSFTLAAPPGLRAGSYQIGVAAVSADGRRSTSALNVIDYPHIRPRAVTKPSTVAVSAARVALPPLPRVGYVRGASDVVPEELAAIGVPIELLGPDSLARGDLSRYGAVVIGSRAYETDPALIANNGRLLDYARGGGLVIVQYQQYPFITGGYAPFPLDIARPHDRVTDERAAVTPLVPSHPLFHTPNEIAAPDWDGWVQERGLYYARSWDSTYVPLMQMADSGEAPLQGGLLIAPLGKGTYVYTGLSFFRQLPAGVPGAYRLFLNLLALRREHVP
jgi:LmbE family N-acetylglucosaminyl deacetylase